MKKQFKKKAIFLKIPGMGNVIPGPGNVRETPGRPWPEIEKKIDEYRRKGLLIDWEAERYAASRGK